MPNQLILLHTGCGLLSNSEFIAQEGTRWLCNFYQFRSDPYRIYSALMDSGSADYADYASYNQLKYVNRSIRLMDAIVASRLKDEGLEDNKADLEQINELNDAILAMNVDPLSANEQNNFKRFFLVPKYVSKKAIENMGIVSPKQVNPILLTLFGNMMTFTKNYLAACCKYFVVCLICNSPSPFSIPYESLCHST
jgi:general transcription factor 3C polypeptide 3 (transcription factor C subunit 4)